MTDSELLKIYMRGFTDELKGDISNVPKNNLALRAYIIGSADALIGDELSSIDLQTNQEILKRIRKDE